MSWPTMSYVSRDPVVNGCALDVDPSVRNGATADIDQLSQAYKDYQAGSRAPLVNNEVANNALDPNRAAAVKQMIGCVGNAYGLAPGMIEQLRGVYDDARSSAAMSGALRSLLGPSAIQRINR